MNTINRYLNPGALFLGFVIGVASYMSALLWSNEKAYFVQFHFINILWLVFLMVSSFALGAWYMWAKHVWVKRK